MRIVDDEYALPAPELRPDGTGSGRFDYVRALTDHHVLVHGKTAETFTRRDGKVWKFPGWKVVRKDQLVERLPSTAYCDGVIYP